MVTQSTDSQATSVQDMQLAISVCKETIRDFFSKIDVPPRSYVRDLELEARVGSIVKSWAIDKDLQPYVTTSLALTVTAYSQLASMETRIQITLFTTIILALDNSHIFQSLGFRDFLHKTCTGAVRAESGMPGVFNDILDSMWDHYNHFSANTIYASAHRFINASILETESNDTSLGSQALSFVQYKRSMSATTEAYACFIWEKARFPDFKVYMQAIPDAMLCVSHINDILSFYKEELAGEKDNYIHERANVAGKSAADTLQEVIDETVSAVTRARLILGQGEARDAFDNFVSGYIRLHTGTPRYRLKDIIEGEYIMDGSSS